jgi:hypothetical protein
MHTKHIPKHTAGERKHQTGPRIRFYEPAVQHNSTPPPGSLSSTHPAAQRHSRSRSPSRGTPQPHGSPRNGKHDPMTGGQSPGVEGRGPALIDRARNSSERSPAYEGVARVPRRWATHSLISGPESRRGGARSSPCRHRPAEQRVASKRGKSPESPRGGPSDGPGGQTRPEKQRSTSRHGEASSMPFRRCPAAQGVASVGGRSPEPPRRSVGHVHRAIAGRGQPKVA